MWTAPASHADLLRNLKRHRVNAGLRLENEEEEDDDNEKEEDIFDGYTYKELNARTNGEIIEEEEEEEEEDKDEDEDEIFGRHEELIGRKDGEIVENGGQTETSATEFLVLEVKHKEAIERRKARGTFWWYVIQFGLRMKGHTNSP